MNETECNIEQTLAHIITNYLYLINQLFSLINIWGNIFSSSQISIILSLDIL